MKGRESLGEGGGGGEREREMPIKFHVHVHGSSGSRSKVTQLEFSTGMLIHGTCMFIP